MNFQILTEDEKIRLLEAIGDSVEGRQITFDEFQELVGLLCEDIVGLECLPDEDLATLVSECWSIMNSKDC